MALTELNKRDWMALEQQYYQEHSSEIRLHSYAEKEVGYGIAMVKSTWTLLPVSPSISWATAIPPSFKPYNSK